MSAPKVTCDMKHQPPMDFAFCETHDTTFALGDRCKFYGREMWEVFAEEANEQRGFKVRAEMERDRLRDRLASLEAPTQVELVRAIKAANDALVEVPAWASLPLQVKAAIVSNVGHAWVTLAGDPR